MSIAALRWSRGLGGARVASGKMNGQTARHGRLSSLARGHAGLQWGLWLAVQLLVRGSTGNDKCCRRRSWLQAERSNSAAHWLSVHAGGVGSKGARHKRTRVYKVHARQAAALRNFLQPQVLLDRHRIVGAALDCSSGRLDAAKSGSLGQPCAAKAGWHVGQAAQGPGGCNCHAAFAASQQPAAPGKEWQDRRAWARLQPARAQGRDGRVCPTGCVVGNNCRKPAMHDTDARHDAASWHIVVPCTADRGEKT